MRDPAIEPEFVFPRAPDGGLDRDRDEQRWRWTLMCTDGATVRATVVIDRLLGDRWNDPAHAAGFGTESRRAAETRGRSVLEARVLGQANPSLRWIVTRTECFADPAWDPNDTGRCRTCGGEGRVDPPEFGGAAVRPDGTPTTAPMRPRCPECQGIDPWTEDDYRGMER